MNLRPQIYRSIAAIVVMIILYVITTAGILGPNPVGQSSNYIAPLIIPAGYAFAIWSIIYIGIIIFPFYQLVKRKEGNALWGNVHNWFAMNVIANGLWLVCASYDWLIMSLVIIVFMLISLYKIYFLMDEIARTSIIDKFGERFVFSLYFAWITLATVLNVSAVLQFYKWDRFGISELTWAYVILSVTALIGGLIFWKIRDAFFGSVIVWAFVAIAVRHYDSTDSLVYLVGGIAIIFIILILTKSTEYNSKLIPAELYKKNE